MPTLAAPPGAAGPTYAPVPNQNGQYSFGGPSGAPDQNGVGGSASYLAGLQALAGGGSAGAVSAGGGQAARSQNIAALLAGSGDSGAAAVHAATVGQAPPTWQQIIQQAVAAAVGPAPSPVTAVSQGAAPTLSQYWDPTPYTNATNAVQAGGVQGIGTINNAYAQALQSALAQGAEATKTEAGIEQNTQQDAASAGNAEHASIAQAMRGMGANSQLGNQMNAQQQTLDQNNQRGVQMAQFLQGIVAANNAGNQQAIGSSKANALQFLGSQVQGELGKIGFAQADAQSTAQRDLAAAQNAYNTNATNNQSAAAKTNSDNQTAYANSYNAASKQAQALALATASTPSADVLNQINNGTMPSNISSAVTAAYFGGQTSSGTTIPKASNAPEALQRLATLGQAAGLNAQQMAQAQGYIQQLFDTTKQAPSASALEQYLGLIGGS